MRQRVSAKKPAVLTYPQYLLITIGTLLSFVLVRWLTGILQAFLPAAIPACVLTYRSRSSTGGLDSAFFRWAGPGHPRRVALALTAIGERFGIEDWG